MTRLASLGPVAWALAFAPAGALVILLAHRTHPVVPLGLVAGLGVLSLAWSRPLLSVLTAVALIPLEVVASLPLGPIALSPAELVFVLTGVVWAGRRVLVGERPWTSSRLSAPLALLWLSSLPGLLVAVEPAAVVRYAIIWGALLLVFQLIVAEGTVDFLRSLLFALAIVGAISGVAAAVGVAGQQELDATGATAVGRATGAFGDPNVLATFLAMALPAALLVAFQGRWQRGPLALSAAAAMFAGLAFSLSRGGFLAAAGAMLVMLGWPPLRRVAAVAAIALVGITVLNANPFGDVQQVQVVLKRVQSVNIPSANQTDQRGLIYRQSPGMITDNILTGVGALNFANVAPIYDIIDPATGGTFDHAHNLVLTIGAEQGILGLIALGWLIYGVARLVPIACGRRAGPVRGIGFAVTAGLVALLLQGVVDYTLRSNVVAALAFVLLGALTVTARAAAAQPPPPAVRS